MCFACAVWVWVWIREDGGILFADVILIVIRWDNVGKLETYYFCLLCLDLCIHHFEKTW